MAALKRQYEAPADEDGRGRTPPGGVKPWLLVAGVGVALVLLAAFDAGSAVSYRPAVRAAQVPLPAASKQGLGPRRHEPRPQCMTGASAQCPPAPAPEFSGARRWAADALPDHLAALDDAIARSTTMPSAAIDARELPTLSPAAAATASADPVAFAAQLEGFLEYGSRPFVALPAYWNTTVTAALRAELRRFQEAGCAEAGEGGDQRTFECERYSALAQRMRDDKLVAEVARKYLGMRPGAPFKRHTVLAGRVAYSPGRAVSSGGGWHRDKAVKGIKSMLYLEEVTRENGPFTMLLNYDDATLAAAYDHADAKGRKTRFNDTAVHRALDPAAASAARRAAPTALEILGAPGTLVIFLTHNIHRGKLLERGERTSITTYYNVGQPPGGAKYRACTLDARPSANLSQGSALQAARRRSRLR